MRTVLLATAALFAAVVSPAVAQQQGAYRPWLQPTGEPLTGFVLNCATGSGREPSPCGTSDLPLLTGALPRAWMPAAVNVIAVAGVYQTLCAQAAGGGSIAHTGAPTDGPLWVDLTGATGATRGAGAMPVYPAPDAVSAPGTWRFPGTTRPVTVMGPAGVTFQAFCG